LGPINVLTKRQEVLRSQASSNFNHKETLPLFAALVGLYLISLYNYLLFHSIAEIFSILIACCIFVVAWNSRRLLENNYLVFIGIAYLFVGVLDLAHTLTYKGMNIFPGQGANLPTQLWITARFLESVSLVIAPFFIDRRLNSNLVFFAYSVIVALLLAVFHLKLFPDCFVEGVGLTLFKKISEYVISLLFLASIALLLRKREQFDPDVLRLLVASIIVTIGAELAFTFYVSVYGMSNLVGHFFKIVSFYLIYKAIIETGLVRPYDLFFRNLKASEESYRLQKDFAESVIQTAPAIVLVLDNQGRIVRFNNYMEELSGYSLSEVQGKDWFPTFLPKEDQLRIRELFIQVKNDIITHGSINAILTKEGEERMIEWFNKTLKDGSGKTLGILSVGQDVTERIKGEKEREKLILDLQDALARVRKLSGLLPICSSCKKIRDDKGYWSQIDQYVRDHSEVDFSHSICPQCAEKLYPDYVSSLPVDHK
jgi:PAS domain S-box-containing protein